MGSVLVSRGLPETWTGTPTATAHPSPGAGPEPTMSSCGLRPGPLPGPVAEGYPRWLPWSQVVRSESFSALTGLSEGRLADPDEHPITQKDPVLTPQRPLMSLLSRSTPAILIRGFCLGWPTPRPASAPREAPFPLPSPA